jgi:hypothetical protein
LKSELFGTPPRMRTSNTFRETEEKVSASPIRVTDSNRKSKIFELYLTPMRTRMSNTFVSNVFNGAEKKESEAEKRGIKTNTQTSSLALEESYRKKPNQHKKPDHQKEFFYTTEERKESERKRKCQHSKSPIVNKESYQNNSKQMKVSEIYS